MLDYNKINEYIYVGEIPKSIPDLQRELEPELIEAVVSLTEEPVPGASTLEYYLWIPIKNDCAGSLEQIKEVVEFIKKMVDEHKRVYIHCRFGQGRAPLVVIAYFVSTGMETKDAIEYVSKSRPVARLNSEQLEALRQYGDSL